ncbi:hypothetical protein BDA99DRAFT_513044 [Phascolomyces articulosus]|uniref:Uncharacterized protein n=1 Tax=Phascolomyces articulosus TaxID=60185 RepID=A0AAD5K8R1_9FUNG|nr:hypothetical protein BDA99DRAFT_513044 [Phascolomyces articulosus]
MADNGSSSSSSSTHVQQQHHHHATPTPPTIHHNNPHPKNNESNNNKQHATSTVAAMPNTPKGTSTKHDAATTKSYNHIPPSNIVLIPSNIPMVPDPYFGKPSPANPVTPTNTNSNNTPTTISHPSTSTSNQQQEQHNSIAGPLVGALLGSIALISIIVGILVCMKRRKKANHHQQGDNTENYNDYNHHSRAAAMVMNRQQQHNYHDPLGRHHSIKRQESDHSENSTLQPPSAYNTLRYQKRLTNDTFTVDQRASMSTMNSNYSSRNHQYTPQLAYKQQQLHDNGGNNNVYYQGGGTITTNDEKEYYHHYNGGGEQRYYLDGISPSNTLIDTTAITMTNTNDEKTTTDNHNTRRQRVPSYQPQVVIMTHDNINPTSADLPPLQREQHATHHTYQTDHDNNNDGELIPSNHYDYLYQSNYLEGGEMQYQYNVNHRP